jgi:hypothetical protein
MICASVFISDDKPAPPAPVTPKPWTPCPACHGGGRIRFQPKAGDPCQQVQDVVCITCHGWGGWGRGPAVEAR